MPVGPSRRYSVSASCMFTTARPESYSCMPASKMPTTVKRFSRGSAPIGVTLISGANTVT